MLATKYWQMQQTVALDPSLQAVVNAILAGITAPDNAGISAIKAKTDNLTFTVAGQVDSNAKSMNDATLYGDGTADDQWRGA